MQRSGRPRARDRGAGMLEYLALGVLAAVILAALVVSGLSTDLGSGVSATICRIVGGSDCGKKTTASGRQPAPSESESGGQNGQNGPRPADPLQVQAADYPKPNPQAQQPPPPNPNANNWGPSTGAGPGNPGIGKSGDLPRGGDHPYVPPKKGRGKPVKSPDGKGFVDDKGRKWTWDRKHKDHWDVDDPNHKDKNGKKTGHINVNPDGSEARNPDSQGQPQPSATPSGQNNGKANSSWVPWAAGGAAAAGGGALLWWGAKVLSPACGPFVLVCAVVF